MAYSGSWSALLARLALRATVNPRLALDLARLAWSFRARDWYRRPPFLPLPPRDYLRWRVFTAYGDEDRKSTRLNSSHGYISYAVFCLKKKKKIKIKCGAEYQEITTHD